MEKLKFAIKTLGCKANQYESQILRESITSLGAEESSAENADIVVINSCTVTAHADAKTRNLARHIHKANPAAKIFLTGCYVFTDEDIASLRLMPEIYRLVPNNEKYLIADMIMELSIPHHRQAELKPHKGITYFAGHTRAFVKIQDGCDQGCAYCKVPLVRGPSRSRVEREVLEETERLAASGCREMILTGICMGSWEGEAGRTISNLVTDIDKLNGDFRFRLSSVEPNHVNKDLIAAVSASRRACRHFHIPLQSGSDRVLSLMKRRYNTDAYKALVNEIRDKIPMAGITTDLIAGFPGETDSDFAETLRFINEIRPSRLHVFTYSDRKGTHSFSMSKKVPSRIARERADELKRTGVKLQRDFAGLFVGREVEVLIEQIESKGAMKGYTGEYVETRIALSDLQKGTLARVTGTSIDIKEPLLLAALAKNG